MIPPYSAQWIEGVAKCTVPQEVLINQVHVPSVSHKVKSTGGVVPMLFFNNKPELHCIKESDHIGEWQACETDNQSGVIGYDFNEKGSTQSINAMGLGLTKAEEDARWKTLLSFLGSEQWNISNGER